MEVALEEGGCSSCSETAPIWVGMVIQLVQSIVFSSVQTLISYHSCTGASSRYHSLPALHLQSYPSKLHYQPSQLTIGRIGTKQTEVSYPKFRYPNTLTQYEATPTTFPRMTNIPSKWGMSASCMYLWWPLNEYSQSWVEKNWSSAMFVLFICR